MHSQSKFTNTTASFDWSSDEDDDIEETKRNPKVVDKRKLPLSKKKHEDDGLDEEPSELQEELHKATTTEGLKSHVVKMLDGLCIDDGLIHEALELISFMKNNGMPDVVVHTAVIEAFSNYPGHSKQALRSYKRMLASGVLPNAYTYSVLIRGLARDGKLAEGRKYVLEMMGRGMRPNAGTHGVVLEAFDREGKEDEGRALLEEMKSKGFVPEEKSERLQRMREQFPVFRDAVMRIFSR
ncbi:Pentatricopeptide repeat-containing protein [Acorus calamus]|uniref:Pentatricopeptide repeat-containing protein n=1 Tax=Acorus calamus TaxID=4465 RepID=A0AAV9EZN3_ACOCL|nr:Pentatricopeptide repeat-containing protein [Acorus calamus]